MSNSLLPYNATKQERDLEAVTARVSEVPVPVRAAWDPDTCPASLLPWLASAFSVDTWDPSWTDAQKRQTIKNSVFVHRHKGTIGAVRSALASLGFSAQVQEWFSQLPAGDPYTFMLLLEADQVGIDQAALARIQEIVSVTKNLRSHLAEIVPSITSATGPMVAAVASIGSEIVISAFSYSLVADGIATANGQYDANGIKA